MFYENLETNIYTAKLQRNIIGYIVSLKFTIIMHEAFQYWVSVYYFCPTRFILTQIRADK